MAATWAVRSIISRLALVRTRSSCTVPPYPGPAGDFIVRGPLADRRGFARHRVRHAALLLEGGLQHGRIDPIREPGPRQGGVGLLVESGCVTVDVAVRLDVDHTGTDAGLHRLVGELPRHAGLHEREEVLDVLRVQAH